MWDDTAPCGCHQPRAGTAPALQGCGKEEAWAPMSCPRLGEGLLAGAVAQQRWSQPPAPNREKIKKRSTSSLPLLPSQAVGVPLIDHSQTEARG